MPIRKPSAPRKGHIVLKVLRPHHIEALRRIAAGEADRKKLCEEIGMSTHTLKNVLASPVGKAKLEEFMSARDETVKTTIGKADVDDALRGAAPEAANIVQRAMRGEMMIPDKDLLTNAMKTLSLTGYDQSKNPRLESPFRMVAADLRRIVEAGQRLTREQVLAGTAVIEMELHTKERIQEAIAE